MSDGRGIYFERIVWALPDGDDRSGERESKRADADDDKHVAGARRDGHRPFKPD